MVITYRASFITKLLSFGLIRNAFSIKNGLLIKTASLTKRVKIEDIDTISYELKYHGTSLAYLYVIRDYKGKEIIFSNMSLNSMLYQQMFRDILRLNPTIRLNAMMVDFLAYDITPFRLKFDFNVHKGPFLKKDITLSMHYPWIDAAIGFSVVFIFLSCVGAFGLLGEAYLKEALPGDVPPYRIVSLCLAGITLALSLTNIIIALVSMYLGHKFTLICLLLSLLFVYIGIY